MDIRQVTAYANSIGHHVPKIRLSTPSEMIYKATKIALPAIALVAMSNARTVVAPFNHEVFSECIEACDRNGQEAGPFIYLCWLMCIGIGWGSGS